MVLLFTAMQKNCASVMNLVKRLVPKQLLLALTIVPLIKDGQDCSLLYVMCMDLSCKNVFVFNS